MATINDAGKMRHRCTFIVIEEVENSRGITTKKKKELFSCWFSYASHSIRDIKEFSGLGHSFKTIINIRSKQKFPINNTMQVKIKNVVYDIEEIIPDDNLQEYDTIVLRDVQ